MVENRGGIRCLTEHIPDRVFKAIPGYLPVVGRLFQRRIVITARPT